MSPAEIGQAAGTVLVGAVAAWQAYRAKRNTRPVSNGFAEGVQSALAEIRADIADVKSTSAKTHQLMLDHLSDHAAADLSRGRGRKW